MEYNDICIDAFVHTQLLNVMYNQLDTIHNVCPSVELDLLISFSEMKSIDIQTLPIPRHAIITLH